MTKESQLVKVWVMAKNDSVQSLMKNNILIIALVLLAFVAGTLWNRVQTLEKGKNNTGAAAGTATEQTAPERPTSLSIKKPDSQELGGWVVLIKLI